jgi:hypothetical protein
MSVILYQFKRRAIKLTALIIDECHSYQPIQNFIQYPSLEVKSIRKEITGNHQCGFRRNTPSTDQISCFPEIPEKKMAVQ